MFAARQLHPDRRMTPFQEEHPRGLTLAARAMGIALSALLVLPIAEVTQTRQAEAGKRFKTVTRTFSSNGQIDIPGVGTEGAANPYPTVIDVDSFSKNGSAKITDVNLTLRGLSHTLTENIDVMLIHNDASAFVMGDPGNGTDVTNLTVTLDDEANAELPDGAVLTSGAFRPGNQTGADPFPAPAPAPTANTALAVFDGLAPEGVWQLYINDDAVGNSGSLSGGWELEITAKVKQEKKEKGGKGKDKNTKQGKKD